MKIPLIIAKIPNRVVIAIALTKTLEATAIPNKTVTAPFKIINHSFVITLRRLIALIMLNIPEITAQTAIRIITEPVINAGLETISTPVITNIRPSKNSSHLFALFPKSDCVIIANPESNKKNAKNVSIDNNASTGEKNAISPNNMANTPLNAISHQFFWINSTIVRMIYFLKKR